jgi:UDP-glucose 4-epimerase
MMDVKSRVLTPSYILLTGGAGYIGSHTYLALIEAGFQPIILDNFANSKPQLIQRLEQISGASVPYVTGDVRDARVLDQVFLQYAFQAVMHFAGLKAVGESVEQPLRYYDNNVNGTLTLLKVMAKHQVKQLVFSSSATVYGDPSTVPITEEFPLAATNPYACSKLMVEEILRDLYRADPSWRISLLRYFNPVGAHKSGLIGEDPQGIPNNLMPYITQVAVGKRAKLAVFGGDYPTIDGTGVRDYIHILDLADGHVKALQKGLHSPGLVTVNLGTGQGYSVLQVIKTFREISHQPIPYEIVARRAGDIASCYADPSLAKSQLGWVAKYNLHTMCEDSWRWQSQNPDGLISG